MFSLDEILYNGHAAVAVFIEQRERERGANLQIQVLGVDDFLKLGFEQLKTKLMQCELCQEFAYTLALQLCSCQRSVCRTSITAPPSLSW